MTSSWHNIVQCVHIPEDGNLHSYIHFLSSHPIFLGYVLMMNSVFWYITPCSQVKVKRRFGETYCLHIQGRRAKHPELKQATSRLHCVISHTRPIRTHRFESVKSNILILFFHLFLKQEPSFSF
jgi:hypothetical protein